MSITPFSCEVQLIYTTSSLLPKRVGLTSFKAWRSNKSAGQFLQISNIQEGEKTMFAFKSPKTHKPVLT